MLHRRDGVVPALAVGVGEAYALWVDYLARDLRTSIGPAVHGGTNYSWIGATASLDWSEPPILSGVEAVQQYLSDCSGVADRHGTFIIMDGVNDLYNGLFAGMSAEDNVSIAVGGLETMVRSLVDAGAKHVILWDTYDLKHDPGFWEVVDSIPGGVPVTDDTQALYNRELHRFQRMFHHADVEILHLQPFMDRLDAGRYGFTNVTDRCKLGPVVCPDPDKYSYWNGTHPTTAGHHALERYVREALDLE